MRLERLHIQGFGGVQDKRIPIEAPVTVLYGPNEAGKSTVLYFIRAMLYGFPGKSVPAERGEPADSGVHGGELRFLDDEGTLWTIRRFGQPSEGSAGSRKERVHIQKQAGDGTVLELGQYDLEREALGGVSKDMFRQLFAISLSELQEIRSLQSAEISGYLFHAGIGGGANILEAERRLTQEMDKLYKPRGKVQHAAKLLQSIEQLKAQVTESRTYVPRYNEVIDAIRETEDRLERLELERADTAEDLTLLRKAIDIRRLWLAWREAKLELDGLPDCGSFPPEGIARWERIEEELLQLEAQIQRIERALGDTEVKLADMPLLTWLEEQGQRIEDLWGKRSLYEAGNRELAQLTAEQTVQADRLAGLLRSIDPGWTEAELLALSTSAAEREEVRRLGAAFAGYDRRMEQLSLELRGAQRAVVAAESALSEARRQLREEMERGKENFAMLKPRSPQETAMLWSRLQQTAERWRERRLSQALPELKASGASEHGWLPSAYSGLLAVMAILTVVLVSFLFWSGANGAAAISGVLMLAGMVYVIWSGRRNAKDSPSRGSSPSAGEPGGDDAHEVEQLLSELVSSPYHAAAATLEYRGSRRAKTEARPARDPLAVEAQLRELRSVMDAWQAWRQRLDRLTSECLSAEEKVKLQAAERSAIESAIQSEEKRFVQLERQWESWLMQRLLPQSLSPDAMLDMFSAMEQGQEIVRQQRARAAKIAELTRDAKAYAASCLELAQGEQDPERNRESLTTPDAILSLLGDLHRRWKQYQEASAQREALRHRLLELQEEAAAADEARSAVLQRKEQLLGLSGAADGEAYLRMGAAARRKEELERTVRHHEITMFSGLGSQLRSQVLQLLESADGAALEAMLKEREAADASLAELRDELQERRGRLLQERESLEAAGNRDSANQQLEEQRAELKELVSQYAVRAIAAGLIERTRRFYEQEKQPQVLRLASRYFSKLTGGTYSRIVMRMGDQALLAERPDGGLVESSKLSRGTAEQLYLAMRLALVQSMPHAAGIPLMLDDLFVNFDSRRLGYVLELISELSHSRQIVMMTCHPHVTDQIRQRIPGAQVIVM